MEREQVTREQAGKLMKISGETRGISVKGDLEYIVHIKGEEGLRKIETRMEELGFPFRYEDIKEMNFYPAGIEALTLVLMKELFDFDDSEFIKMGQFNSKVSLIVRLFMKYFVSMETIANESQKFWSKYYTEGTLKVTEINKDQGYIIVRIDDFQHHPFHCLTVEGYLISVVGMVLNKKVECKETKCIHRGDDHHEFIVKWLPNGK